MTTLERLTDQRNITTITFDMDDTLWDFQSAMERALELTLEQLRVMAPGDAALKLTVQQMMDIRDEVASELGEGATTQEEIRYTAMVRTVEHVGFRARGAAEELYRLYWEARVAGARPYDDVAGVLAALRSRFRLGIISNGNNTPKWWAWTTFSISRYSRTIADFPNRTRASLSLRWPGWTMSRRVWRTSGIRCKATCGEPTITGWSAFG